MISRDMAKQRLYAFNYGASIDGDLDMELYRRYHKQPRIPASDEVNTFWNYGMNHIEVGDYKRKKGIKTPTNATRHDCPYCALQLSAEYRSKAPWE